MLKIILKFGLALGLVWWLLQSGKLDFSLVYTTLTQSPIWVVSILLIIFQFCLGSLRWKLLLEVESKRIFPIIPMIRLTWIGLFFNSFLPGAVTGDLIKLVYARHLDPSLSKTTLITTAFLDRILGLTGLLCLMGLSSLVYYSKITEMSAQMAHLIHFNLFMMFCALIFISTLFFPKKGQAIVLHLCQKVPLIGHRAHKMFEKIWLVGSSKKTVLISLLISCVIQFTVVLAFWLLTSPFYGKELSLPIIFTFIPAGLIAVAIPIAPAGLGVGHLAFDTLFGYVGIQGGASLFNLFYLSLLIVCLFGVFPYLSATRLRKKL